MAEKKRLFTPWSSLSNMLGKPPAWWPAEEQHRIQSYEKYDQLYWNDPTQYAIRVLENEQPIYVPNARIIVDTTAQYLMKGLKVTPSKTTEAAKKVLEDFLKRERFYSKFHLNKQAGITRGDSAWHITADPTKPEGSRISIDTLHPGQVYKVFEDEVRDGGDPDKVVRMHVVDLLKMKIGDEEREMIRKLTYSKVDKDGELIRTNGGLQRILRYEALWEIQPEWYGPTPKLYKQILPEELLPESINEFPIYWFPNIEWESQQYGSSELRGLEFLEWAVSQGTTDTQMALGLEGLGVYATDGGRPVDDRGRETDWEVAPGKVMEVPQGSYFRRVEGVGSITPMMDQTTYLEQKMFGASGLTDVALGRVDVAVAQSGIALAIKFMPTLARIEHRDTAGVELLQQMFYNLLGWFQAYDPGAMIPEVDVDIAKSKLPANRTEVLNELNNMLDRKIISRAFYRQQVKELGYDIPENMEAEILEEKKADIQLQRETALASAGSDGSQSSQSLPPESNPDNGRVDRRPNQSNNRSRPNESSGTESGQTLSRQSGPR